MTTVSDIGFDVPTGREEAWRFTPVPSIAHLLDLADATAVLAVAVDAPAGVMVRDQLSGPDYRPVDRASQMAWTRRTSEKQIMVAPDTVIAAPITVSATGSGGITASHLRIEIGAGSRAEVIVDHRGAGEHLSNIEFLVADNATATLVCIQDWDDGAVHLGHQRLVVGRDATLTAVTVSLGGRLIRLTPTVEYAGPGGNAELLGLYFADAGQRFEHRSHVDHSVPHCRSNVIFKGALQGEGARSIWVGDVLIRPEAVGTQTYEINRNLLLDDGPRADSVPNLEILTGDVVGAGHASATGRFDEEQVFYLRSRGIPEADARRLVVLGFFGEILDRIDVPLIRTRLMRAVETEIGYMSGADS